jgi:hypothetical protein
LARFRTGVFFGGFIHFKTRLSKNFRNPAGG